MVYSLKDKHSVGGYYSIVSSVDPCILLATALGVYNCLVTLVLFYAIELIVIRY